MEPVPDTGGAVGFSPLKSKNDLPSCRASFCASRNHCWRSASDIMAHARGSGRCIAVTVAEGEKADVGDLTSELPGSGEVGMAKTAGLGRKLGLRDNAGDVSRDDDEEASNGVLNSWGWAFKGLTLATAFSLRTSGFYKRGATSVQSLVRATAKRNQAHPRLHQGLDPFVELFLRLDRHIVAVVRLVLEMRPRQL